MVTQLAGVVVTPNEEVERPNPPFAIDTYGPTAPPMLDVIPDNTNAPPPLSQSVINDRASVANFAIPDLGIPEEEIRRTIAEGQEDQIKNKAAGIKQQKQLDDFTKLVKNMGERKQGPLNTYEQAVLWEEFQKTGKTVDPSGVIEEEYAKQYLAALTRYAKPGHWLYEAAKEDPKAVSDIVEDGVNYVAKDQYIRKNLQDLQAEAEAQGWLPWAGDVAKDVFSLGIYSQVKLHGNVKGADEALGLGTSLKGQKDALYRQDFSNFKKNFDEIITRLKEDNPSLAVQFATSMLGASRHEINAGNLGTAATAVGIPGTGSALRTAATKAGVLKEAGKAVEAVIESNVSRYATKISDSHPTGFKLDAAFARSMDEDIAVDLPHIAAAEAVGDLETAAVDKVANGVIKDFSGTGTPVSDSLETLHKIHKEQRDDINADIGTAPGARELANRLIENINTTENNTPPFCPSCI